MAGNLQTSGRPGMLDRVRARLAGAMTGLSWGLWGAYGETTRWSPDRGAIMYYLPAEAQDYLDSWTRNEIYRKVEWLLQTFAIIREGVRGVARHTVGDNGIVLQHNSNDEEWNELAEADWERYAGAPNRFDLAGKRSLYDLEEIAIEYRIKAGEFWALHAKNPRWDAAPCVQLWDPLSIETPGLDNIDEQIRDGVRVDGNGAAVEYFVRQAGGGHRPVPASEMVHWFKPDHIDDVRAVSELATAVNPLVDAKELIAITTRTAKQNTALGLHIKKMVKAGGQGALDKIRSISGTGAATTGATTNAAGAADAKYEKLVGGGAIIYTDEDGDAKILTPNSPTPLLEPFITKVLMRNALATLGPPSEFYWALDTLNGVAQRVVLVKADAVFRKLGSDLAVNVLDPMAVRYHLHRVQTGRLRACRDSRWIEKMEWQLPGRLSIDNGRDAAAEISQLSSGIETLRGINERRGRGWRKQIRQWFLEFKFAREIADQLEVQWALPYWRANNPGAQGGPAEPDDGEPGQKPKNDPEIEAVLAELEAMRKRVLAL